MRVLGAVVGTFGLGLALRSGMLLAGRGRPRRGPRPALVLAGPYLRLRNPLLAGAVLALVGAALLAGTPLLWVLTAAAAIGSHLWVVRVEEPRLLARFGTAYAEYLRAVPRWLPARRPRELA